MTPGNFPLRAALHYALLGFLVFPVHSVTEGGACACPDGSDCDSPGKHPRTEHGFKEATTEPEQIRRWWGNWPDASIGIRTGRESGIIVLDVDPRNGGDRSLVDIEKRHGKLPKSRRVTTGSGGEHIYFRYPTDVEKIRSRSDCVEGYPGLDVKADGGYVVAPPSRHASGEVYEWQRTDSGRLGRSSKLPPWLLELLLLPRARPILVPSASGPASDGESISEGQRDVTLASLAGTMRRRGMTESEIFAALLEANRGRCDPPLPDEQVEKIARSISRYPAGDITMPNYNQYQPATRAWPEPPAKSAFYGLAGEYVEAVDPHSEGDPAAILTQLLVAFGNVVGRGPHWKAGEAKHFTNLYCVVVGDTASSRKGTSLQFVRRLMLEVDQDWALTRESRGLSTGEGLIHAVRDPVETQDPETGEPVILDSGGRDKRLFVIESEFASVLKRMYQQGNTLSQIIRQAWDGEMLSTMTKTCPGRATEAHISIAAHITETEVLRYLNETEAGNGFANRFIWICAKRSKFLPEAGSVGKRRLRKFAKRIREAAEFAGTLGEMIFNNSARGLWHRVYPNLSVVRPGLLWAVTCRAEAQVRRLATVYALLARSREIKKVHLEAALALWDYAERSAQYIFGDSLGDPVADRILTALRAAPGGMTGTDIQRMLGGHGKPARIHAAFTSLQQQGLAKFVQESTGGRPATRWFATEPAKTTRGHKSHKSLKSQSTKAGKRSRRTKSNATKTNTSPPTSSPRRGGSKKKVTPAKKGTAGKGRNSPETRQKRSKRPKSGASRKVETTRSKSK